MTIPSNGSDDEDEALPLSLPRFIVLLLAAMAVGGALSHFQGNSAFVTLAVVVVTAVIMQLIYFAMIVWAIAKRSRRAKLDAPATSKRNEADSYNLTSKSRTP